MECDSASSCEDRLQDLEGSKQRKKTFHTKRVTAPLFYGTDIYSAPSTSQHDNCQKASTKNVERSLSSQVKEYYNKYSQNSNLDRYFSHPEANLKHESYEYHWRSKNEDLPLAGITEKDHSVNKDIVTISEIPKERRKWVRPPLIGQPSGASSETVASNYSQKEIFNNQTPSPEPESTNNQISNSVSNTDIQTEDTNQENTKKSDNYRREPVERETKIVSPTSSIASYKPLEWDSGADVGYALSRNKEKENNMLGTFERMILAKDLCSVELRLDPEGTTGSTVDQTSASRVYNSPSTKNRRSKPNANSTRLVNDQIESEDEIEITPIVKPNKPGIIAGNILVEEGDNSIGITDAFTMKNNKKTTLSRINLMTDEKSIGETPKTSTKYATEKIFRSKFFRDFQCDSDLMRKKSASMNILALSMPFSIPSLTRSQSELNLDGKTKRTSQIPLDFASSSSIATIVNKPVTCDKDIQTNLIEQVSLSTKESIGIQVSSIEMSGSDPDFESKSDKEEEEEEEKIEIKSNKNTNKFIEDNKEDKQEEEKPPLPERVSSLGQNKLQSILKNSDTQTKKESRPDSSQSERQEETTVSDAGRASNSFEYFPGHVYQNVVQTHGESTSHVSSVDTGRSHSTMPNTSSSLDGKLWGDSDSLVRDLERSVNVLKLLLDANKYDKHVKKRLIHHVIKRLVTAKYTDDKIEHNLEENVPWNPDNARNKVYRADIIQALATKQKQSNTSEESSEDWKPRKRSSSCGKTSQSDVKTLKEIIRLVVSSENSDLFEERHTDRTDGMQDGRTARMGLRTEDRHQRHHDTHDPRDTLNIDTGKSESSECFVPTPKIIENKKPTVNNSNVGKTPSTTITSNSTDSASKRSDNKMDWRLPATMSERQFELERSSYRAGVSSKLIDYVQMEKKNQLVWINNEINHLSCLKKLLEEPKRYTLGSQLIFEEKKNLSDDNSVNYLQRREMSEEWSSHGNLAEKKDKSGKPKQTRQQNCCTQTKTSSDEIEIHDVCPRKSTSVSSVYDQTLVDASSTPVRSPRRYCTRHENKKNACTCSKPTSSSLEVLPTVKATNSKPKSQKNPRSIVNSKKDTKNRLNDWCRSEVNTTDYQTQNNSLEKNPRHCKCCRCTTTNKSQKKSGEKAVRKEQSIDESDECTCNKVQDVRSCRVCGTHYSSSKDRKCKCVQTYNKPIAYELSFEQEKKKKSQPKKKEKSSQYHLSSAESFNSDPTPPPPLQDFLTKNKPDFVDKVEKRQRCMSEITQLRQLKKEKRDQYLSLTSPSSLIISQIPKKPPVTSTRKISEEEMKTRLRLRYLRLNEVKSKRHEKKKEEQARRNHLMARIYCKKLQQKVLKGQVDLSQSVSVISNL